MIENHVFNRAKHILQAHEHGMTLRHRPTRMEKRNSLVCSRETHVKPVQDEDREDREGPGWTWNASRIETIC